MKTRSPGYRVIAGLAAFLLAVGAIASGAALYDRRHSAEQARQLQEQAENRQATPWTEENTVVLDGDTYGFDHRLETFLFIGTDASGNETGEGDQYRGAMADFLLLMVLDHTENTIGYLQIDRNTVTEVTELDRDGRTANLRNLQICTAHWYGYSPEMSAENTVTAVRTLLGELDRIDGYYVVNMNDIGVLNQAVGGVEITFDEDLTAVDPAFVKGATLTLSDDQAERFIRARMGIGNEDNASRMSRQRRYMDGFFQKVRQQAQANPQFSNALWKMLRHIAVTDMNGNAFSRIAQKLLKGEDIGILRLQGETRLGGILGDGKEHEEFYPEDESIRDVMTRLFSLVPAEGDEDEDENEEYDEDEDDDDWDDEDETA